MAADVIDFAGGKQIYSKEAVDNFITIIEEGTTAQFDEFPSPVEYAGKVIQYIGPSGLNCKRGYFYCSNGLNWIEWQVSAAAVVCNALPIWTAANDGVLYFVAPEASCYIKGQEVDEWVKVTDNKPFELVADLPTWHDGIDNKIYLKTEPGATAVVGWVKNPDRVGEWLKLGGISAGQGTSDYNDLENTPTINGMTTKGDAGRSRNVELNATVNGENIPVNELEIESFSDTEIDEAFGL